jgi:hypothetical protein
LRFGPICKIKVDSILSLSLNPSFARRRLDQPEAARGGKLYSSPLTGRPGGGEIKSPSSLVYFYIRSNDLNGIALALPLKHR